MSGAAPDMPAAPHAPTLRKADRVALRTSLIWHDEVMDDIVSDEPHAITLGADGTTTFTVPDIGLPNRFTIVRPGNRGYLLTLGEHMRGTICVDGVEKSVEEFVRRGGEGDSPAGGFRATPISGRDWGVVDLDETGAYKLFFQFVPVEDHAPFLSKPVLYAMAAGYAISIFVLAMVFSQARNTWIAEAFFRAFALTTVSLGAAALLRWLFKQDSESQASFAFSVMIHAALLIMTYRLYDGNNPFVWPGPRDLTGSYLATRLEPEVPPEPPKPVPAAAATKAAEAAPKSAEKQNVKTATKGEQGASGGKGETERARDPNAKPNPDPPKVALFTENNRKVLDNLIERNLPTGLSKFQGMQGELRKGSAGFGPGSGTGVGSEQGGTGTTRGGKGHGPGGGGNVDGDFVSEKGPIDPGKNRPGGTCVGANCHGSGPKEVKVGFASPSGDMNGLTAEEIDRVVRARSGIFRACYQHELNRNPGIGGKLVIRFTINGEGAVTAAATGAGNGLHNEEVESCVKANVQKLKFPAKGGTSNVNYPFIFSQGG